MTECNECELEWKNTTNGYGSGGLSIFCADIEYRPYMQLVSLNISTFKCTFSRRITNRLLFKRDKRGAHRLRLPVWAITVLDPERRMGPC